MGAGRGAALGIVLRGQVLTQLHIDAADVADQPVFHEFQENQRGVAVEWSGFAQRHATLDLGQESRMFGERFDA